VYCPGVSAQSGNAIILGFAFMNQFTTRFDVINARIGFAPTAHCGQPATLGPHFNVTVWGDCTSNDCSGQGTQNSLNSTCVYENGTAAISPSICANQTQTFTRYCDNPTRPSSCTAGLSSTILILIIVFAIVGLFLAFFLFYQFYGRVLLPNNIAARRPV
jgi:hypothetical protein